MFDQLTWATGMFTLTAFVAVTLIYSFRNNAVVQTLIFHPARQRQLSVVARVIIPGLAIAAVYFIELGVLWMAYGQDDSTAIDWAVIVLLSGTLLAGPAAGAVASALILPARALIYFATDSDNTTFASYANGNGFMSIIEFTLDESWIWWQPGVVQLAMALVVGGIAYALYRSRAQRNYPFWIGLPLAIGVNAAFVFAAWQQWGEQSTLTWLQTEAFPACIALTLAISIFVFALSASRAEYERARLQQARVDNAENQLRFLNAQISPHFLNNALNAIGGIMHHSPDHARDLLGELGDYFRHVCASTDTLTLFANELDLIKNYVNLEQARYGERLSVEYEIDNDCLSVQLPRLTLQPIVENAIKHGIAPVAEGGRILISASMRQQRLNLDVRDNGAGSLKPLHEDSFGVGLSNVHARLKNIYGDNMTMAFDGTWGGGTHVRLSLGERLSDDERSANND